MNNSTGINIVPNYYGSLHVKEEFNKYWWAIEDWNGFEWGEIPKSLYDELIKFNQE